MIVQGGAGRVRLVGHAQLRAKKIHAHLHVAQDIGFLIGRGLE